ncbi:ABC transporter permease [Aureimonas leprariae]|uniref:Iron ABC transporter permease n=1 Tax=Plantimonas leprariae TaxID=2615207 RepID=A0A7V7PLT3_9HYPH|nr:iron ABC transporter permease [Aureimonas leprariae]KAB0677522.1 iron ABC transporter permease [Aureimonas leprariae]
MILVGRAPATVSLLAPLRFRLRSAVSQPIRLVVVGGAIAVLLAIVAYPLAYLLKFSLTDPSGRASLATLRELVAEPGMTDAVLNSTLLVLCVTAAALALGVPLAWLVARTDVPGKAIVAGAAGVAFVIPTFVTVIAWMFLAAPNSGYLNKLVRAATGSRAPAFDVVSFSGLVFMEAVHLYPLVFFAVTAALANVDASNEQAAQVLGAGRLRTLRTITLPLVLPAVLASAILVMLDTLSSFGAPAVIGTMANFQVLTTKVYDLVAYPPRLNLAAATAMPIVAFTLLCLGAQRLLIGRDDYRTLTGKAVRDEPVRLGRWRPLATVFVAAAVLVTAVLPVAALALLSTLRAFGLPVKASNLVLDHYRTMLDPSFPGLGAMQNSLILALATATVCVTLGTICAWVVERSRLFGRGAITTLIMIAYGFPSIAFGLGIMLGYVGAFYGTLTILLIAYAAKQLPVAYVMIRSGLKQITADLEEAARISGASWLRTLLDITLPLVKGAAGIAWILIFSLSLRELSMSVLLSQTDTQVMSTIIVQFIQDGAVEPAAALSIVVVAVSLAVLLVVWRFTGRSATEFH